MANNCTKYPEIGIIMRCFDLGVLELKTLMNEVNESHFINIVQCF